MYEDDQELARRLISGDEKAFDAFFSAYYDRVYRFCLRRLDQADAEDVALESMRQAMRRIETYRGEALLVTWLFQVARSQVSAFYKSQRKHRSLVLIEDDAAVAREVDEMAATTRDNPQESHADERYRDLIHFVLDSLPGEYGQILQMKYIEGLSVEEIAHRLALTVTAIQSKLARARQAFRREYTNTGGRLQPIATAHLTAGERS